MQKSHISSLIFYTVKYFGFYCLNWETWKAAIWVKLVQLFKNTSMVLFDAGTRRKLINTYKHALLATMNRTLQKSIGHQVEDLILDCEWNGEACGPQLVQ